VHDLTLIKWLSLASWVQDVSQLHILTVNLKISWVIFNKTLFHQLNTKVKFKVSMTEMYPRIPWQLLANPLVSAQHTFGTTDIQALFK
jgi:hypothetical protein